MKNIIQYFSSGQDYQHVLKAHQQGVKEQLVAGLSGSSRTLFMSALYLDEQQSQLIVTHNLHQAQKLYEDLIEWVDEDEVFLYPVNELISSEIATASPELRGQRIKALNHLIHQKRKIVIVPIAGLRRLLPPYRVWKDAQIKLEWGQDINLSELKEKLLYLGYQRVEMVEAKGEYSIRGGIMDIYPASEEHPLRLELFDTEIDSIRTFDIETQRSINQLKEVIVGPTIEWVVQPKHYEHAVGKLEKALSQQLEQVKNAQVKEKLLENMGWEIEQLRQQNPFQGMYKYISCFYGSTNTLLDYLSEDTVVIFDEPARIQEAEESYKREEAEWQTSLIQAGEFLSTIKTTITLEELKRDLKHSVIYLSLFLRQIPHTQPQNIIHFTAKAMQNFHGQLPILEGEISRWKKSQQAIVFLASDVDRAKRMVRVLEDFGVDSRLQKKEENIPLGIPVVQIGQIQSGFELPLQSLVVITESEVFTKQQKKKAPKQKNISNAERIKNYSELHVGDYVVHVSHGIGKYLGIETLEIEGIHKDYLNIKYAGNDKLFVPVEQIDQVQKYVADEEKEPKVYALGGNEWKRVKSRVKSSVQDIAADLIKLYAKRQAASGFGFGKDTSMHNEFEAMFPYQETADQIQAIEEIKEDMEKSRPMDRLLCGDVGYGKTEVAIRAAFKAVMDGKQVAILVPTTILAQQHHETFKERFNEFPVQIEVMSRFRSRKEQNQTVKKLKDGLVDIVIGTHRLLSKDVQFKDLGLLIVDEEQRFGVSHKEKIKQLKENVDVLTLTATPIPRTLHMSMLGVKDLSVIETPPENRFPVQSYVVEYNAALVREAIEREMARGGQVFFLFNQVKGIEKMSEQIRSLVPDAKVAIAHGQMKESELEAIMIDFLEGQFDVLVSTTIIETGVDIPNVNTLIIYNADKMGLSQLYQLRGRVGRSNRMAYAYFTYQRDKVLTEVAEKRLQAIKEFTELGSGFKIAMRDLSIRGAGNLLGAEQHGFIASVGFDLYSQMLKEAIEELKGEKPQEEQLELEVDVHIDAYLPETYINDGKQKIEMYKKVAAIDSLKDSQELEDELIDRFGSIPSPVWRLLQLARMKVHAKNIKMDSIVLKNDTFKMMFHPSQNDKIDGGRLFHLVSQFDRRVGLVSGHQIGITCNIKRLSEDEWLPMAEELLSKLDTTHIFKEEKKHALQ